MINRTAVKKKVALVTTNASANKKIVAKAKVMKRKRKEKTKKKALRLNPENPIIILLVAKPE